MNSKTKLILNAVRSAGLLSASHEAARLARLLEDPQVSRALNGTLSPTEQAKLHKDLQAADPLQLALFEELFDATAAVRTPEGARRLSMFKQEAVSFIRRDRATHPMAATQTSHQPVDLKEEARESAGAMAAEIVALAGKKLTDLLKRFNHWVESQKRVFVPLGQMTGANTDDRSVTITEGELILTLARIPAPAQGELSPGDFVLVLETQAELIGAEITLDISGLELRGTVRPGRGQAKPFVRFSIKAADAGRLPQAARLNLRGIALPERAMPLKKKQ